VKTLLVTVLMATMLLTVGGRTFAADEIPWGVGRIRANLVWNTNAGNGITIAVIDTGVVDADYYQHPDLVGKIVAGETFVPGSWWDDLRNHGTLVAGIMAAIINDFGLIGVSPGVNLIVAKAVPPNDIPQDYADALYWSKNQGAQIVVMSFGENREGIDYSAFQDACNDLYINYGILLIAAAGNDGVPIFEYPALYSTVIAVGAVDENDNRWSSSNYGSKLELMAPGVLINSTANPYANPYTLYAVYDGTSFAAPHVAGVAALIYASKIDPDYDFNENGRWDNFEVREKLQNTTLDLGSLGRDDYYGYGLVNAWYSTQRPPGNLNNDSRVNILDIVTIALAYGSKPGDPNWCVLADITIDRLIDINDIAVVALHFGEVN
jgi:subtilisin family serine protease